MVVRELKTEAEIMNLIDYHNGNGWAIALDTETTGLDRFKDKILLIVLTGYEPDSAVVFSGDFQYLIPRITCPVVLHNFKFDYLMLGKNKPSSKYVWDTMLLHHLYNENLPHSLDSIVKSWFNDNYKEVFWSTYKTYEEAPLAAQHLYAGKDVIYTLKVFDRLQAELQAQGIPDLLVSYIHDFAKELLKTEEQGVRIDIRETLIKGVGLKSLLKKQELEMRELVKYELKAIEMRAYIAELDKRVTDKGKEGVKQLPFNFGSSKQLQELLYKELKLPVILNQARKVTVDDAALEQLASKHPLVDTLREHRGTQKVYSSFIEALLSKARDNTIYPSFNINGTVTGRISSSEPNMQQLPRSGGIRGIFKPRPGYSFISCDYKQLEVTLAAHFSLDDNLLKVINEGASLHDITAKGLGIDRQNAKTINFAVQYGAGVSKIQKILGCSKAKAEQVLEKYWLTYPKLKLFMDECHALVDQRKPLVNPLGRQRRFDLPVKADQWEIARAKRQAFNALIQGTGADITNLAYTRISQYLGQSGQGRGLFVIHDEILLEVQNEYTNIWDKRLQETMIQIGVDIDLRVPLAVDSSGPMDRWLD